MKKTIFTFCSVVAVCTTVFLACSKDDNGNHQVSYASQTTYGSGNNPNPNNNPSSTTGGVTTSTTGTVAATYGTFNNGTSYTFTSSTACGGATWVGNYSSGQVTLSWSAAPTVGTYTTVNASAGPGQVIMYALGGTVQNGGIITVTSSGGKFTAAFTSILFGSTPITGSLKCM